MSAPELEMDDSTIARHSPDLIISASMDGKITSLNPAFERLTGFSRADWIGRHFHELVHPDDRDLAQAAFEGVLHFEEPPLVEVRLFTRSRGLVTVEGAALPHRRRGELVGVLGVCRETTERRRAEEQLRLHARRQSAVADLGARALAMRGAAGVVPLAVNAVVGLLGDTPCHCLFVDARVRGSGHPLGDLALASRDVVVVPDFRSEARFDVTPFVEGGFASGLAAPVAGPDRPFGALVAVAYAARTFSENDVHFVRSVANTIGWAIFRHEEESARRRLLARLLSIQDEERRQIARELHDDLGQLATGLKLGLEAEERARASGGAVSAERMREMRRVAGVLLERVRDLSTSLRPPMLDELGLVPALAWHFERYTLQTHVGVAFHHESVDRRLEPALEAGIFRVVQEALTNIARHSGADEATVSLSVRGDRVHVAIVDRGRGFDPDDRRARSSGLAGARERVHALGGAFSVSAQVGRGVTLEADMPLTPPAEDAS